MPNGQMRTMDGMCLRRMRCNVCATGKCFIYDLGRCSGPGYVAKFVVQKPAGNQLGRMQFLGYPQQFLKRLTCEACGPYMVLEQCLARGEMFPSNSERCGEHYQADPGWTKMPSQYVGDAAVQGRQSRMDALETPYGRLSWRSDGQQDLIGLASTDWDGLCGSYATDGLALDSFFVFHRANATG